jgi:tetratricopeptide (TPR) repeat protein
MKRALPCAFCLLALASCTPADPAAHAEAKWAQCRAVASPEYRIDACSEVIDSGAVSTERRAAALVARGSIRSELGQHARAVADFGRALRLDPDNALALLERGRVHHDRGAYDSAVRDYDAALAIDPALQLAAQRRLDALEGRAQEHRAEIDFLTEALARDPMNAELLNNRCWLRAVRGEALELALADCDAALRINPAYGAALDSRGLVRLKRGEYEDALADYEAALAVEPGRGHYLYGRGLARLRLGMTSEAEADLADAERAEPGVAQLYAGYGMSPAK